MEGVELVQVVATLVGGYLTFHFVHYATHRWLAHRRVVGVVHRAHANGHHRLYTFRRYVAAGDYAGVRQAVWLDLVAPLPILVGTSLVLPAVLFRVLWIEVLVLGVVVSWVHRSFHVEGHFLKRWFARADRLHAEHHRDPSRNFGFLFHGFDRLLGTFAEPTDDQAPKAAARTPQVVASVKPTAIQPTSAPSLSRRTRRVAAPPAHHGT